MQTSFLEENRKRVEGNEEVKEIEEGKGRKMSRDGWTYRCMITDEFSKAHLLPHLSKTGHTNQSCQWIPVEALPVLLLFPAAV